MDILLSLLLGMSGLYCLDHVRTCQQCGWLAQVILTLAGLLALLFAIGVLLS